MKKREPTIKLQESIIKCDNIDCDFKKTVPIKEVKKYVNHNCPICYMKNIKSKLLTRHEYIGLLIVITLVKIINLVCYFIPKKKLENDKATMSIKLTRNDGIEIGPIEKI